MSSLNIRVSGRAEFSHIKKEVKDLDVNLKKLRNTVEKGVGQGFLSNVQNRQVEYFFNQLKKGQEYVNKILNEERTKIEDIQKEYKNASSERKRQLKDELEYRKQIVKTYEEELEAIKRQEARLRSQIEGMDVKNDSTNTIVDKNSFLMGFGKKALSLMGFAGITAGMRKAYNMAKQREILVSQLSMRLGEDDQFLRKSIRDTGLKYGYDAIASMQMVDLYTSRAGRMTREDQAGIQALARGFGIDSNIVAGNLAEIARTGLTETGKQRQFADLIANAIEKGRMQERAVEAMETTAQLISELSKTLPEVTKSGVIAYQTLLNMTGIEGFRGERGADILSRLNQMFLSDGGASEFFILRALGWGEGQNYYEAKLRAEEGLSNINNLYAVLSDIKNIENPQMQDIALSRLSGLSLTQAKTFREATNNYNDLTPTHLEAIMEELKVSGTAEERAEQFRNTVGGHITYVEAKWDEVIAKLGEGVVVDVTNFKEMLSSNIDKLAELLNADNPEEISPTTIATVATSTLAFLLTTGALKKLIPSMLKGGAAATGAFNSWLSGSVLPMLPAAGSFLLTQGLLPALMGTSWFVGWAKLGQEARKHDKTAQNYDKQMSIIEFEKFREYAYKDIDPYNIEYEEEVNKRSNILDMLKNTLVSSASEGSGLSRGKVVFVSQQLLDMAESGKLWDVEPSNIPQLFYDLYKKAPDVKNVQYNPFEGYKVSSNFGYRTHPTEGTPDFHTGVDFSMPMNTPLRSTGSGEVVFTGQTKNGGNIVKVKLDSGETIGYYHMNEILAKKGQRVEAGDILGYSGNTGRSTGPHLHFSVMNKDGEYIDPLKWLEKIESYFDNLEFDESTIKQPQPDNRIKDTSLIQTNDDLINALNRLQSDMFISPNKLNIIKQLTTSNNDNSTKIDRKQIDFNMNVNVNVTGDNLDNKTQEEIKEIVELTLKERRLREILENPTILMR